VEVLGIIEPHALPCARKVTSDSPYTGTPDAGGVFGRAAG
jgi:hypothetical protein